MRLIRNSLLGLSFLAGVMGFSLVLAQTEQLPSDSVYQLQSRWQSQQAVSHSLADLAGKKQVLSMIYTHCLHTCPTTVATMQAIAKSLPEEERAQVGFVLVSLTPASDTPTVLKAFAEKHHLDPKQWLLLTGDSRDVRTLAMLLGVKYKATPDNEVAHSNLLSVLDEKGRLLFQEVSDLSSVHAVAERIVSQE